MTVDKIKKIKKFTVSVFVNCLLREIIVQIFRDDNLSLYIRIHKVKLLRVVFRVLETVFLAFQLKAILIYIEGIFCRVCNWRQNWELRSQNTGKPGASKDMVCIHPNNTGRYHNVGLKNRKTRITQGALNPKVSNIISVTDSRKGDRH